MRLTNCTTFSPPCERISSTSSKSDLSWIGKGFHSTLSWGCHRWGDGLLGSDVRCSKAGPLSAGAWWFCWAAILWWLMTNSMADDYDSKGWAGLWRLEVFCKLICRVNLVLYLFQKRVLERIGLEPGEGKSAKSTCPVLHWVAVGGMVMWKIPS